MPPTAQKSEKSRKESPIPIKRDGGGQTAWRHPACHLRLWLVLGAVLWADLASKRAVFGWLGEPSDGVILPGEPGPKSHAVVRGLLEFRTQHNLGAALGFMQGQRVFFIAAGAAAVVLFLVLFARTERRQWFLHAGIGLILGGALGNIYDRVVFGMVRDFIHVTLEVSGRAVYPWIFNVADMALVVGAAAVFLSWLRHGGRRGGEAMGESAGRGRAGGAPGR